MNPVDRRNPIAVWYEQTPRPWAALLFLILVLYAPSLNDGFILDDHRAMRILRTYHAGERPSPDVYRFLTGDPHRNSAEREEGWYAWWMADELKYQHMRPLAEWMLYGEYLLFGERPIGYRLVSLILYAGGVLLVLSLFRLISGKERAARWAALIFAVAASHAIPVMFVSSQGDVAALVCAAGAAIAASRCVSRPGSGWVWLFVGAFAVGLCLKEAMLPVAAAPYLFWRLLRSEPGAGGRAALATALAAAVAFAWLAMYLTGGYGSNSSIMLDPVRDFTGYILAGPYRALLLLSAWVLPVNPFLFDCRTGFKSYEWTSAAIGGAALAPILAVLWARLRRDPGAVVMALWVMIFLPILVCTPADDRVMMLPSIGLSYLAALWMTLPRSDGSLRLRMLPVMLLILLQAGAVVTASRLLAYLESEAQRHLKMMAADDKSSRNETHIFVVNNPFAFEGLFMKDRLRSFPGMENANISLLSDISDPQVTWPDQRTMRLEARTHPLLSSFLGRMGAVRGRPRRIGDTLRGDGFEASIVEVDATGVRAVELRFDEPVNAGRYRFYRVDDSANPLPVKPGE